MSHTQTQKSLYSELDVIQTLLHHFLFDTSVMLVFFSEEKHTTYQSYVFKNILQLEKGEDQFIAQYDIVDSCKT